MRLLGIPGCRNAGKLRSPRRLGCVRLRERGQEPKSDASLAPCPPPPLHALSPRAPLIERLVGFDTESSKSNLPLIESVEDYLGQLNVPFVRVPNPDGNKAAMFVTVGPMNDGGIVLSGYTDVVPSWDNHGRAIPSCYAARAHASMAAAPAT